MIKHSKKVLKYLNANTNFTKGLAISNIALSLSKDLDLVENAIDYLLERKLIKILNRYQTYNTYVSNADGRDYFKIHTKQIIKDYVYPVIISVITSLIALLLSLNLK